MPTLLPRAHDEAMRVRTLRSSRNRNGRSMAACDVVLRNSVEGLRFRRPPLTSSAVVLTNEDIPGVCAEYATVLLPGTAWKESGFEPDAERYHFLYEVFFGHCVPLHFLHLHSTQIMKMPIAAMKPMATLRDSARTLTSTESAPSLISADPAISMRIGSRSW
jgi:hypothetical protein